MANFISFAQSYKGKKIINKKLLDVLHLVYVKINYYQNTVIILLYFS